MCIKEVPTTGRWHSSCPHGDHPGVTLASWVHSRLIHGLGAPGNDKRDWGHCRPVTDQRCPARSGTGER